MPEYYSAELTTGLFYQGIYLNLINFCRVIVKFSRKTYTISYAYLS